MKFKSLRVLALIACGAFGAAQSAQAYVRMYVHQEVADYAAWRQVYNDFEADRRRLGVVFLAIFRGVEDPNEITFLQDFNSLQEAKAFAASPEFKSTMDKGRVKGKPEIWYASKALQ